MIVAVTAFSCGNEEVKPQLKVKEVTFSITAWARNSKYQADKSASLDAVMTYGTYEGEYKGSPEVAATYLNKTINVKAGQVVDIKINEGQTLFVQIKTDKAFVVDYYMNGELYKFDWNAMTGYIMILRK